MTIRTCDPPSPLCLSATDGMTLFAVYDDGAEIVEAGTANVDVVLMDIRMPRMNGIRAAQEIKKARQSPEVIMLTTFDLSEEVTESLRAGAAGYVTEGQRSDRAGGRHSQGGERPDDPLALRHTTARGLRPRLHGAAPDRPEEAARIGSAASLKWPSRSARGSRTPISPSSFSSPFPLSSLMSAAFSMEARRDQPPPGRPLRPGCA